MAKLFVTKVDLRRTSRQLRGLRDNEDILFTLGDIWRSKFEQYIPGGPESELAQSADVSVVNNHAYVCYDVPYAHYLWEGNVYVDDKGYSGYPIGNGNWIGTPASKLIDGHKHWTSQQLNFNQGVSHWTDVSVAADAAEVRKEIKEEIAEYFLTQNGR